MSRTVIRFWVYVLPLPLFVVMYFVWAAWSDNRVFALYVMLLPLFYGYVAPGIATNLLHKWRFKGPWVVGSYYAPWLHVLGEFEFLAVYRLPGNQP